MKKDPYASEDFTKKYLELSQLPEPLRLAAGLEETMQWPLHGKAADCLRRLHEENERLKARIEELDGNALADAIRARGQA